MAQNISPEQAQSSTAAKQNDEAVTVKDNHAVSKRLVSTIIFHLFITFNFILIMFWDYFD